MSVSRDGLIDEKKIDVTGSAPDVSESEMFRESFSILEGLIRNENVSVAVIHGDPPAVAYVNQGMTILTGYSEDELMRFGLKEQQELIHPDHRDEFFSRYFMRLKGDNQPRS